MDEHEREIRRRMAAHELYTDHGVAGLAAERARATDLTYDFNATRPSATDERQRLLRELFAAVGDDVWIEPTLRVAYGSTTRLGNGVYANFGLTLVDDVEITVGDRVMFAPNVTISTTGHPVHPDLRPDGTSSPRRSSSRTTCGSGREQSSCRASPWGGVRSSPREPSWRGTCRR